MTPEQNSYQDWAFQDRNFRASARSICGINFAVVLASALLSTSLMAQSIFGTAKVHEQPTSENVFWTLKGRDVDYPQVLIEELVSGCLVVEMDVSKSGRPNNIEVLESFPPSGVERPFRRALNRIRWMPLDDNVPKREERRQVRVDFCASSISMAEARAVCAAALQQPCQ